MTERATQVPAEPTLAVLLEKVAELTVVVEILAYRFRRKRLSDAVLAVVVVAAVVLGCLYYFVELPGRRADTRGQIRNLACYAVRLRPPGYSPTSDGLRARYKCPPFDPAALQGSAAPSPVAPSSSDGSTPTAAGRGSQRPSAAATRPASPSARLTAAGPRTASTTPSRPVPAPGPSRPVASTGGRDASPTSTPLIQLPSVSLCSVRVAGVGLCPG